MSDTYKEAIERATLLQGCIKFGKGPEGLSLNDAKLEFLRLKRNLARLKKRSAQDAEES